ncbi:DAN domain family member 5-like [Ochotona princeps]|uniref:DAN domain family member 5 n=1 Tax=Ochotona princeps TaxID=9978 RepID=UPI002714B63A|nr:DAN domain family member 5 [Ochotona princeps]XP_058515495.1 DAN domain family member 5-like [Ochotona princeps]
MQVPLGRLAAFLGLLSAALLPLASGKPRPQPWAASNETRAVPGGAPVPPPGLGSWKAFLGLQRPRRLRVQGASLEVAPATISLPLDPQQVTQEVCKAVPFTQVLSRPGCSVARLRNHICFGRCTSVFVPGSDPASLALCNSCEPGRQRRTPVVLWCQGGGPVSTWRRVKMFTVLINSCQCGPKP